MARKPEPKTWANDADAPLVDVDKLRRFYHHELPDLAMVEVSHLIAGFRAWHAAFRAVVGQEASKLTDRPDPS